MKRIISLSVCFLSLLCCTVPSEEEKRAKEAKNYPELILGKWHLNEEDLYKTIHFKEENKALIENHIDTLFRWEYHIKGDTIRFSGDHGLDLGSYAILKLDGDSLVIDNLPDKAGVQRYSRKEKKK